MSSKAVSTYVRPTDDIYRTPTADKTVTEILGPFVYMGLNTVFQLTKTSLNLAKGISLPFRILDTAIAISNGNCLRAGFNAIGFSALFFSHGYLVAIGVDLISGCATLYRHRERFKNSHTNHFADYQPLLKTRSTLNPNVKKDAAQILDLSELEAVDKSKIETAYQKCKSALLSRKDQASPILAAEFKAMLEIRQTAYETLIREANTQSDGS